MSEALPSSHDIVWMPTPEYTERAHLTAFMRQHGIPTFDELIVRSAGDVAWFTDALLKYLDIRFYQPYSQVMDLTHGVPLADWCVGGQMNIVHNCLDKRIGTPAENDEALIWEGEEGEVRRFTYRELWTEVNRCAAALHALGLGHGDAIGLFMPMTPEIVIALLAIAKVGGIILPLFSGFGEGAIASRLADAEAKALFTSDGAWRRGKRAPMKTVADAAVANVPTLQHMIVVRRTGDEVPMTAGRDHWWHELVAAQDGVAETMVVGAETPLMIIYTSGTTGRPKGAVHTHCGFPIKAAQDMAFGTDVHGGDRIHWLSDMGWMMGPWLVFGTLILGSTMVLFDGAPDFPGPDRLWALVERHQLTHLGISPTLVRSLIPQGLGPVHSHDLRSLRFFASTGEPWNPDPWLWLFGEVGEGKRPIINYSGGTEISGGIVMGNPLRPLKPCAFGGVCPGIAADVLNEAGESVRGEVGELVIKAPWIGMTRGFWRDPQRYLDTYWSRWPNTWVHGDFAMVDEDGLWYILGRSDDTIKIAGKRLGPAEIESIAVHHPAVLEAAAIGVPDEIKGSALVVFAVLKPGALESRAAQANGSTDEGRNGAPGGSTVEGRNGKADDPGSAAALDAIRAELRDMIIAEQGKPLAPKVILFVADLPKTRNAKVMRRMVRAAYLGQEPGDTSALVNPAAVEEIGRAR